MIKLSRVYLGVFIAFIYVPFVPIVLLSFADQRYASFPPKGLTFKWYSSIPSSYFDALLNSVLVAAAATIISSVLAVAVAIGLYYKPGGSGQLIPTFLQAPLQVPALVIGVIALQFFVLLARSLNITLIDTIPGLAAAHVIFCFPLAFGPVHAMLQRSGRTLEEAAASLGASGWSIIRRVMLPSVQPAVLAGALYAFVLSFSNVTVSLFLVGRDIQMLPVLIMHVMEFDYQPHILSVSGIIIGVSFVLVYVIHRVVGLDSMMKQNVSR